MTDMISVKIGQKFSKGMGSTRFEYDVFTGEYKVKGAVTWSGVEIIGATGKLDEILKYGIDAIDMSHVESVKYEESIRKGLIVGTTIKTDGSVGVRVGLGSTKANTYLEMQINFMADGESYGNAVGKLSSMRMPGSPPTVEWGYQTNALDVLGDDPIQRESLQEAYNRAKERARLEKASDFIKAGIHVVNCAMKNVSAVRHSAFGV